MYVCIPPPHKKPQGKKEILTSFLTYLSDLNTFASSHWTLMLNFTSSITKLTSSYQLAINKKLCSIGETLFQALASIFMFFVCLSVSFSTTRCLNFHVICSVSCLVCLQLGASISKFIGLSVVPFFCHLPKKDQLENSLFEQTLENESY